MNESGRRFLRESRLEDQKYFEIDWKNSHFSELKSFIQVGIDPKTTFYSLWQESGNKGEPYRKYLVKARFTYEESQRIWGLVQLFTPGDMTTKIGDFVNLKESDLEGISDYNKTDKRILVKLFASL